MVESKIDAASTMTLLDAGSVGTEVGVGGIAVGVGGFGVGVGGFGVAVGVLVGRLVGVGTTVGGGPDFDAEVGGCVDTGAGVAGTCVCVTITTRVTSTATILVTWTILVSLTTRVTSIRTGSGDGMAVRVASTALATLSELNVLNSPQATKVNNTTGIRSRIQRMGASPSSTGRIVCCQTDLDYTAVQNRCCRNLPITKPRDTAGRY